MEKGYEARYHRIEEENWWFVARRHMIKLLLEREGVQKKHNILDIGCSGGALMQELKKNRLNVTGCDVSKKAIEVCRKRGLPGAVCCDAQKLPFRKEQFDYIIASDILEHIKNDRAGLGEWERVLKKGGRIILFVPAFMSLWSEHDEANHHFRRYSKRRLLNVFKGSGFLVRRVSYWNFLLFFPVAVMRAISRLVKKKDKKNKSGGDLKRMNPAINLILKMMLKAENHIINTGINLPVGISLIVIARKK